MQILTDEDFPAVRAALDITLDAEVLPDDIIALPMFMDTAEDEVMRRIPDWAALTGSPRLHLHNAVIKLVAAILSVRMPDVVSETFGNGAQSYKRQPMNWMDVAGRLNDEYEEEIQTILNPDRESTDLRPTVFSAVGVPRVRRLPHIGDRWWGVG